MREYMRDAHHTIVWIVGGKRDERDDEEGWMREREYGQRFRGAR
jgi:hypothetical protein